MFKTKDELEIHLSKVHKVKVERTKSYMIGGVEEQTQLFDNEGVDMSQEFLSLKKKKKTLHKDDYFDNTFDIRDYFTKKKQQRLFPGNDNRSKPGLK